MNSLLPTLLNDTWTIYMTFSGVLISIITLLYSVILGKRSELELYAEQSKLGKSDPLMRRKHRLVIKIIKRLATINKQIFIILCGSLINCALSWFSLRFMPPKFHSYTLCIIGLLSIVIIFITVIQLRKLYIQYKQDIAI